MMNFYILTLFPEMVSSGLHTSIIGRAVSRGLLSIRTINIRDYAFNKHQSVDDYPYGGGAGMLMQAEPVYLAYEAAAEEIKSRQPDPETEKSPGSYTFLHREKHLARKWRKNWQRKKI